MGEWHHMLWEVLTTLVILLQYLLLLLSLVFTLSLLGKGEFGTQHVLLLEYHERGNNS